MLQDAQAQGRAGLNLVKDIQVRCQVLMAPCRLSRGSRASFLVLPGCHDVKRTASPPGDDSKVLYEAVAPPAPRQASFTFARCGGSCVFMR